MLVERFGERHLLAAITVADAERWRRWLLARPVQWDTDGKVIKTMAPATVSKHVKRAKTMFAEAVKDRLLPESPFAEVRTGSEVNRDRDHYIDRATAAKVLAGCPDHNWRLVFAFARFGGLRRCEILAMKWGDILQAVGKMRINSPKTGLRFAPLFPELRPFVEAAFHAADDGAKRCIGRYDRLANLGTQLNRIIESAGVEPWPKTFKNLRATRRTELQEHRQDHVVNAWMGHSSKTAEKHYLQVTDEHWSAGANAMTGDPITLKTVDSNSGGPISANPRASTPIMAQKNPVLPAVDVPGTRGFECLATPQGLEP